MKQGGGPRRGDESRSIEMQLLAIDSEQIGDGAEESTGRYAARSATRIIKFDEAVEFAHPSGHGAKTSVSFRFGLPSGAWPLTEARGGLQQQWPSSTQQAIAQTSDDLPASITGAERDPINKAITAPNARNLANEICRVPIIGGSSYTSNRLSLL